MKNIAVILFFLSVATAAKAQTDSTVEISFRQSLKSDSLFSLKSRNGIVPFFFRAMGDQACAPFHMNGKQALVTAGVAVTTIALFTVDQKIDDKIRPVLGKNKFLDDFTTHFTELGDYYGYGFLAGYGIFNLVAKRYKGFHTAVLGAEAVITTSLWVRAGKILCGRMRPGATYGDQQYNTDHWFGPFAQFRTKYNSGRSVGAFDAFPSGHTSSAFAIASVFAVQYSNYKAVPVIAYSLAGLVGVSRLFVHEHWLSDVVAGGFIGYLCGHEVCKLDRRLNKGRKDRSISLVPSYSERGMGISFAMSF